MGALPDNSESRNKLKDIVEQLESPFGSVAKQELPKVTLDEINYTAPSDEFLKINAENALADYRASGEKAIRDNSAESAKTLASQRDAYEKGRDADRTALNEQYDRSAHAIDNDAIKRGLARSSIVSVNKGELENQYLKLNAEIAAEYGKKISDIDAEIAAIDGKLKTALNDFNLSYATKLNEKLAELRSERDKRVQEVVKFNNDVRAKQADLDGERAKTESDLYSAAIKQEQSSQDLDSLSPENRDKIFQAVYDKMDEYLGGMTPQQAKLELLNHTFYRQHLSNYYYNKLMDKYGRIKPE